MKGAVLAKLGITEAEFLELASLVPTPYSWVGDQARFDPIARFQQPPIMPWPTPLWPMHISHTSLLVENTVSETDVFNETMPGGLLAGHGGFILDLDIWGLNNSGGTRTVTWKGYYGATSIATPADSWGAGTSKRWQSVRFAVLSAGTPTSQYAWLAVTPENTIFGEGSMSEDSDSEKALRVTVTFSFASVSLEVTRVLSVLRYSEPIALRQS